MQIKNIKYILIILILLLNSKEVISQNKYWENIDGIYGGFLFSVETYKNYIYCAGYGGVFGSTDIGESWTNIGLRNLFIYKLKITSDYIFAISPQSCFRCRLNDTSWTKVLDGDFNDLAVKDSMIFISSSYGFYRSKDSGNKWERLVPDTNYYYTLQTFITSNNNLIVSASGDYSSEIFISKDMGDNWITSSKGIRLKNIVEYDNILYASEDKNSGKIYESTDYGKTWVLLSGSTSPSFYYIQSISIDKATIYVGTNKGIFISNDQGRSWESINNGLTSKDVFSINTDGSNIFCTTFNGLYQYSKTNLNWTKKSNGINNVTISSLSKIDNKLLIGTSGSGLLMYANNKFKQLSENQNQMYIVDLKVHNNNIYFLSGHSIDNYYNSIYFSNNYGANWGSIKMDEEMAGLRCMEINNKYIFTGGESGLFRKPINSNKWEKLVGLPSYMYVSSIAYSDSVILVVRAGTPEIYRSTDFGDNWQKINVANLVAGSVVYSHDRGIFYLGSEQINQLFKSTDYGVTWKYLDNPKFNESVNSIYIKDNEVFVGLSKRGILNSNDSGLTWNFENAGLASKNITCFTSIGDDVFAGSHSNGLYKREKGTYHPPIDSTNDVIIPLSDSLFFNNNQITLFWSSSKITNEYRFQLAEDSLFTQMVIDQKNIYDTTFSIKSLEFDKYYYWRVSSVTLVSENHFSRTQKFLILKPTNFNLYNNYPNPFKNTTNIKYDISKKSFIELDLFDILGRKIRTLVKGERNAGTYIYAFKSENMASGIYVVRLKTKGYFKSIKIVLLK